MDKERRDRPGRAGAVRGDSWREKKHVHFHCKRAAPATKSTANNRRRNDVYVQRRFAPVRLWFDFPATAAHGSLPSAPHSRAKQSWRRTQDAECTARQPQAMKICGAVGGSGPNTTCWAVVPLCAGTASGREKGPERREAAEQVHTPHRKGPPADRGDRSLYGGSAHRRALGERSAGSSELTLFASLCVCRALGDSIRRVGGRVIRLEG